MCGIRLKGALPLPDRARDCKEPAISWKIRYYLGHEDIFAPEAIVGICIIIIDIWNRDRCPFPEVVHGSHLRLGLEARHEATSDAGNQLACVSKSNKICLYSADVSTSHGYNTTK